MPNALRHKEEGPARSRLGLLRCGHDQHLEGFDIETNGEDFTFLSADVYVRGVGSFDPVTPAVSWRQQHDPSVVCKPQRMGRSPDGLTPLDTLVVPIALEDTQR